LARDLTAVALASRFLVALNIKGKRDSSLAVQPVGAPNVDNHDALRESVYLAQVSRAASGTDLPTPIADPEAIKELFAEASLLAAIFIWAQCGLQWNSHLNVHHLPVEYLKH
jgi:hypothetical protein